jgi:hypothetical protein
MANIKQYFKLLLSRPGGWSAVAGAYVGSDRDRTNSQMIVATWRRGLTLYMFLLILHFIIMLLSAI